MSKIQVELPEFDGFEYTGEYRRAQKSECFYNGTEQIGFNAVDGLTMQEVPILKRTEPQTLEDRIKAEYSGYEVVMCKWDNDLKTDSKMLFFGSTNNYHVCAQSMPFFHEYVYEGSEGLFTDMDTVLKIGIHTIQPVAALFEVAE